MSHFKITAKLGEGGMGAVYLAEDTNLKRKVALKVLPAELAGSQERLGRFQREAESLATLNHPNIVRVYGVETDQAGDSQVHFLTMELVEGESLEQIIPEGGLPLEQVLDLAIPMADAVAEAHEQGIIHRDLKPANVMVDERGTPKILDFGLAKLRQVETDGDLSMLATATMTQQGVVLGTIPYMSPEQVQGLPVDHLSDLFSFGAVLYEMITGRRPFGGSSSAAIAGALIRDTPVPATESHPGLPRPVLDLLDSCLEKDPKARVQTAGEIRDALQDIRSGKAALSKQPSSTWFHDHLWRTPMWRVVVSAAVVAILALAYVGLSRKQAAPEDASSAQQTTSATPAEEPSPEISLEADAALQRAGAYAGRFSTSFNPEDFDLAMAAYQEALALEPSRAQIPAAIAMLYRDRVAISEEPDPLIAEIEIWALRAIELDSGARGAWDALTFAERFRAQPNFRKIIEYSFRAASLPSETNFNIEAEVITYYSAILGLEGQRRRIQLAPLSLLARVGAAMIVLMLGRADEGLELVDEALQLEPDHLIALIMKPKMLAGLGRVEEARELVANPPPMPDFYQVAVSLIEFDIALAAGDEDAVREGLPTTVAILLHPEIAYYFRWPYMAPPAIRGLATNGYVEEALDLMSQLHEADLGDPPYDWLQLDPIFDPMRNDPRYQAVEAQAKENFDLMMEYLDEARSDRPLPSELEQARVDLIAQLGG